MSLLKATEFCSIEISADGVALACLANSAKITTCAFYPCQRNDEQLRQCLIDAVLRNNLEKAACSWVLHPSQYHLTLVDTPSVPQFEYKDAVRWQVKDVVNYPLEDVTVDVFYSDEFEKRLRKIYVVVAQSSFLQNIVNIIQECDLQPTSIDVREFAIRNLVTNLALANEPIGFFDITDDGCLLVIVQVDCIRFVRHIPAGFKKSETDNCDELTAEIRRSFDYCTDELKQTIPAKFFMAPSSNNVDNIKQNLAEKLGKEIAVLDLQKIVSFANPIDLETQARCWVAIGGALRK